MWGGSKEKASARMDEMFKTLFFAYELKLRKMLKIC